MQEPEAVFGPLGLTRGETVLDLGCGAGEYALCAARLVGEAGRVLAMDRHKAYADDVAARAAAEGLRNLEPLACDMTAGPLPVAAKTVDVCLLGTVLHALTLGRSAPVFRELRRVLKDGGRLAVIECQKREMPFGPPVERRIAPQELEAHARGLGFIAEGLVLFEYNYMLILRPADEG